MNYTVSATDLGRLLFAQADTIDAALQHIAIILSTPKGSVPLYREFGLDWSCLDRPMPAATVLMRTQVREAVERWEPRATVLDISFSEDPSKPGVLIPTVEVELNLE